MNIAKEIIKIARKDIDKALALCEHLRALTDACARGRRPPSRTRKVHLLGSASPGACAERLQRCRRLELSDFSACALV